MRFPYFLLATTLFVMSLTTHALDTNCGRQLLPTREASRTYDYTSGGLDLHFTLAANEEDVPKLENLKMTFDPRKFLPGSYFRLLLGNKALDMTKLDVLTTWYDRTITGQGYDARVENFFYVRFSYPTGEEGLYHSFVLQISEKDGRILGEGRNDTWYNSAHVVFAKPPRDRWIRLQQYGAAQYYGRGIWTRN